MSANVFDNDEGVFDMDGKVQVEGLKSDGRPIYHGVAVRLEGPALKRLLLERVEVRKAEVERLRAQTEEVLANTSAAMAHMTKVLPHSLQRGDEDPRHTPVVRALRRRMRVAEAIVGVLSFVTSYMEVSATYVLDANDLRDFDLLGLGPRGFRGYPVDDDEENY